MLAKPKYNVSLLIAAVGLAVFGIVMQYSASSYTALKETGDAFFYVKKQAIALVVGLVAVYGASKVPTAWLKRFAWIGLLVSYALLAAVFIPGLGIEKYGATRWINLGFTTFQPSEIAKICLAVYIAAQLSEKSAHTFRNMFKILCAAGAMCVLILLEPNMSITMCVALVVVIMLFVGGCRVKQFAVFALPAIAAVVGLILLEPYRIKRLMAFIDPWASPLGEGYQLIQSYYALGGGGLFGVGLFQSRQKYAFLPFAESDFIFSIIGEELGWVGCVCVLSVFAFILWQGVRIAMRAENRFDSYLASGVVAVIGVQTLLNIAVVTGSIPPTGLPLPFVSAGGSSLVVFLAAIGLLQNVHMRAQGYPTGHKL